MEQRFKKLAHLVNIAGEDVKEITLEFNLKCNCGTFILTLVKGTNYITEFSV